MAGVKLQIFSGMIPAVDERLLPDKNAASAINAWLGSGDLQGFRLPVDIFSPDPASKYVYRVPRGAPDISNIENSFWLEFVNANTHVVRSPITSSDDPTYYWANTSEPPGYTSYERLEDALDHLVLGIPTPGVAPGVVPSGGVSTFSETRAYVYTWVSTYGEEGPPSPPTTVTGKVDDTWDITVTAPAGAELTDRVLEKVNIYRTVTSAQGVAEYYFVAEQVIADTTYSDTLSSTLVASQGALLSTDWSAPPTDLAGITTMANGMLAGWRDNEVWFCEPYRPHAWPAAYQISTDSNIVGLAAVDQNLVICTETVPYVATGVHPASMTLRRLSTPEPCTAHGSIVPAPNGVYYTSPNGLILVTAAGARNVTKALISRDRWQTILNLSQVRAALLAEAYYVYSGAQDRAFQADAFQNDAFQQAGVAGTLNGLYLDVTEGNTGVTYLTSEEIVYNVMQDDWTGELFLLRADGLKMVDVTSTRTQGGYFWQSKLFALPKRANLGACKVTWELPTGVTEPTTTMRIYADGVLRQTKVLPDSKQIFRLPSGFKATEYQFELEGTLLIKSIELAATVRDLQRV